MKRVALTGDCIVVFKVSRFAERFLFYCGCYMYLRLMWRYFSTINDVSFVSCMALDLFTWCDIVNPGLVFFFAGVVIHTLMCIYAHDYVVFYSLRLCKVTRTMKMRSTLEIVIKELHLYIVTSNFVWPNWVIYANESIIYSCHCIVDNIQ